MPEFRHRLAPTLLGFFGLSGTAGAQCIDYGDFLHWAGAVATPDDAYGVAIAGRHVYVACASSGFQVVEIGVPSSPEIVGSVDTPGEARGVAARGSFAYVADEVGLSVIDVTDPFLPQVLGSVETPGTANAVAVDGDFAYVADLSGLRVVRGLLPCSRAASVLIP